MKFGLGLQVSSLDVANYFDRFLVMITSQIFSFVNEDTQLTNNKNLHYLKYLVKSII